jgi:hypothetical protein
LCYQDATAGSIEAATPATEVADSITILNSPVTIDSNILQWRHHGLLGTTTTTPPSLLPTLEQISPYQCPNSSGGMLPGFALGRKIMDIDPPCWHGTQVEEGHLLDREEMLRSTCHHCEVSSVFNYQE